MIAVPGIGVLPPEDWRDGSERTWLEAMADESFPNPAIYAFDHGLDPEGSCTWTEVFEQGSELLEALLLLKDEDQVATPSAPRNFQFLMIIRFDHVQQSLLLTAVVELS